MFFWKNIILISQVACCALPFSFIISRQLASDSVTNKGFVIDPCVSIQTFNKDCKMLVIGALVI